MSGNQSEMTTPPRITAAAKKDQRSATRTSRARSQRRRNRDLHDDRDREDERRDEELALQKPPAHPNTVASASARAPGPAAARRTRRRRRAPGRRPRRREDAQVECAPVPASGLALRQEREVPRTRGRTGRRPAATVTHVRRRHSSDSLTMTARTAKRTAAGESSRRETSRLRPDRRLTDPRPVAPGPARWRYARWASSCHHRRLAVPAAPEPALGVLLLEVARRPHLVLGDPGRRERGCELRLPVGAQPDRAAHQELVRRRLLTVAGNAVGKIVPGGGATATAFTVGMLRRAGGQVGQAAAALTSTSVLQVGTRLALPLLALPAIIGGARVAHSLAVSAYLGIAVLVLLVIAGVLAFAFDRPLEWVGRAVQWTLNETVRRRRKISELPRRLLDVRDFVRPTLGRRWKAAVVSAAGATALDFLALLCALRAVGAQPQPSLVLLAFASAGLLALIPLTPGGLGFVEAGLVGTLTLAGVSAPKALVATLAPIASLRTGCRSRPEGSRTCCSAAAIDRARPVRVSHEVSFVSDSPPAGGTPRQAPRRRCPSGRSATRIPERALSLL